VSLNKIMPTQYFAGREAQILTTLSRVFEAQGRHEYVRVLNSATPLIEFTESDDWNGGTFYYTLFLEIPIPVFAETESSLSKHESEIAAKLQAVVRETGSHILNRVVIRPKLVDSRDTDLRSGRERAEAIWGGKPIKAFV
jgi:hypothetical protein